VLGITRQKVDSTLCVNLGVLCVTNHQLLVFFDKKLGANREVVGEGSQGLRPDTSGLAATFGRTCGAFGIQVHLFGCGSAALSLRGVNVRYVEKSK
jgi:hypothetical protein